MNINLDDELRQTRAKFQAYDQGAPVTKWVLIIALGVLLGSIASTLAIRAMDTAIIRYQLHEMSKKLEADQAKMKARRDEQNKINAARLKQQQIENEKKQAGFRQAMETCNYWRDQYRKDASSSNQYQRDQSCSFVNEFR